ncbi:MAG: hypothetical protein MUC31_09260, partial [Bacteroidales bacterium]|nr:hypothetical protein [Bacteroidales bacterium]
HGPISFSPDCETVKGPERIIDRLDSVSLGMIRLDQLNQNYTGNKSFPEDSSNVNLTFSPSTITYSLPVEKFTEAETVVPVKIMNTGGLKVKIFPDKVKIYYTVTLKDYPRAEPEMIHAVADFSPVSLTGDDKIKVSLESYPSFIRINKIEPEKVEFIIIK